MQYKLAYGREQLNVELPEKNVVKVLKIQPTAALEDPLDAVFDVLEDPIESEPLAAVAEGKKSACVVVCDGTRPAQNPIVLPPILQTLEDSGVDVSKITILVATGLHRSSTNEERQEIIGEAILLRKFKVSDHNAKKMHQHEYLGVTKSGTPIWIDRRYLEADIKILTGVIEPHSIVGFNGGRSSICPGIATAETIVPCYSPKLLEDEHVGLGKIEDNPIHAEQTEIARKAGCDFIVNVILNQDQKIAKVVGGHFNQAFLKGTALAQKSFTDSIDKQVDIVVTTGGGYPYDKTFGQTIRGIVGALDLLKPGGTIIIASACNEGIGSSELEELADKFSSVDDFLAEINSEEETFTEQWQLLELIKVLHTGKVKVVSSGLAPEVLQKFFVESSASVEEALAESLAEYGSEATIAVIPQGPNVLAFAKHKEPNVERRVVPVKIKAEPAKEVEPVVPAEQSDEPSEAEEPVSKPTKKAVKKTAPKKTVKTSEAKERKEAAPKKTTKKATKKS